MADGNDARFFADHNDHGVGFLAQSQCRPVPGSQGAIQIDPLADGENARGRDHPFIAQDDAAVVQGCFWEKNAHRQFRREFAIDGHAGFRKTADIGIAFNGHERAKLPIGQLEGDFGKDLDGFAVLGDGGKKMMAAKRGQGASQFRLKNNHKGECQEGDQVAKKPADLGELENFRTKRHQQQQHGKPGEHFGAAGATEKDPGIINGRPDNRDFEHVAPMLGKPCAKRHGVAIASVIRSA